jgi:hypothetical protein
MPIPWLARRGQLVTTFDHDLTLTPFQPPLWMILLQGESGHYLESGWSVVTTPGRSDGFMTVRGPARGIPTHTACLTESQRGL